MYSKLKYPNGKFKKDQPVSIFVILEYEGFLAPQRTARAHHLYKVRCTKCGAVHEHMRQDSLDRHRNNCKSCPRTKQPPEVYAKRQDRKRRELGMADSYMKDFYKILPVVRLAERCWPKPHEFKPNRPVAIDGR